MSPTTFNPDVDSTAPTASAPDESADVTSSSWAVSLCFWFSLMFAACIYATVALAPKFAVWYDVRHEYRRNAEQMIALEEDVDYLERVQVALETDPEFLQRLAGLSKPTAKDNEEFIPVSGTLLFGYRGDEAVARPTIPEEPPYHGLVMTLATRTTLRSGLLTFSACLIVFAFTFFNDAGTNLVNSAGRLLRATAMLPVRRYFHPAAGDLPVVSPSVEKEGAASIVE